MRLFPTLRNYKLEYIPKDIFSGVIIAAVSIPISMGYAQIAGLPAVYGLYGSVLPILFFALFSTSKQFVFGVDATPAAIVGGAIAAHGFVSESEQAMLYIPMVALFAGLWLIVFYFLRADKIIDFISTPVMGGFISGIAVTIILMQVPKLMGSPAGRGEILDLSKHILHSLQYINWLSLAMGSGALVLLLAAKRYMPKFPMAILIMAFGVLAAVFFHVEEKGVILLSSVEPGLPELFIPQFHRVDLTHAAGRGLMVAVVVMAETLLAENSFSVKNGYKLDIRQEILACAAGNLAASAVGCCPVNGSISRTSMNEQYGGKTQGVSITAAAVMAVILMTATGFIGYLPVPVLTAIVISALLNVVESHLAVRLFKVSRSEFYIFIAAGIGVLWLGTIYGVVIGILLSFVAMILKATNPPRAFRGLVPGKSAYYDLDKNRFAYPIKNVVIYRFSEDMFFANIKVLQSDIESRIEDDTKVVVIDAEAVNNIDFTAADAIEMLFQSLEKRGVRLYITGHTAQINEQMRHLGIGHLIEEGRVRRTILSALKDAGIEVPCRLDIPDEDEERLKRLGNRAYPQGEENTLEEFVWAFGQDSEHEIEKRALHVISLIRTKEDVVKLSEKGVDRLVSSWGYLGALDEDLLLRSITDHVESFPEELAEEAEKIFELIDVRRRKLRDRLLREHPEMTEYLEESREHRIGNSVCIG